MVGLEENLQLNRYVDIVLEMGTKTVRMEKNLLPALSLLFYELGR